MSLPMDHNYFNYHEKRSGGCFDGPFKKTPPAPPKPFSSVGENQPLGITPFEPRAVVAGWQIIEAAIRIIATLSDWLRSEEHTSELQSLMRISYAVFCLKKKKQYKNNY